MNTLLNVCTLSTLTGSSPFSVRPGLSEAQLQEIESRCPSMRESTMASLEQWRKVKGGKATLKRLTKVLKMMKFVDIAGRSPFAIVGLVKT
jgi:hypothetical protein